MATILRSLSFCLTILLSIQVGSVCFGQPFDFFFHRLSPSDGLSQGTNAFVYQDTKGFVWLSSIDGLNRFDGNSVKIYRAHVAKGLHDNIITSHFFEDKNSNLWFVTYEGIQCYVRNEDRFYFYQLKDKKRKKITKDYYAFHLDKKGKLWVRTGLGDEGALHLFDIVRHEDQIIAPIDGQRIYPVLDDRGEVTKLVCTYFNTVSKKGLEVLDIQGKNHYSLLEETNLKSYSAVIDQDSLWWLGMAEGLIAYNPLTKTKRVYAYFQNNFTGDINALCSLQDSLLIVNSVEQGVLIFDKTRRTFVQQIRQDLESTTGLNIRGIDAFYVDRQENLWLSSVRGGVNYTNLSKQKFGKLAPLKGIASISMFQSKDGRIWCNGSTGEVLCFEKEGIEPQIYAQRQPDTVQVRKMEYFFEDKIGHLWAVASNNLYKKDAQGQVFRFVRHLPNYILYAYQLSDGSVLMSTYTYQGSDGTRFGGVFNFYSKMDRPGFNPAQQLGSFQNRGDVTAIYEDQQQHLYLAIDAKRLVMLNKNDKTYQQQLSIENIGYARGFYEQNDTLWVATTTGLLKINTRNATYTRLNEKEHHAPQENYYCVLPDSAGNLWLSCNQGIICYNPIKKAFRRYTLYDGLQDVEFNKNAFLRKTNGEIWMGGNKGVNVFHPQRLKDVKYPPKIQFTNLRINDKDTNLQIGQLKYLKLPFKENTISFEFVAMEYSDPKNNTCEYQLENYDAQPLPAGSVGFARYADLPPGKYIFKVWAANSDQVQMQQPQSIAIYIRTPWYRTWWFYVLSISLVAAIVYGIFTYRLRQALKIERIRVRISSDLHDDVGTLLSGLAMQSEILELTAPEQTKPKLQRISELSRSAMSRMRDTVWAIDARKDKLENLLDRMREHAEETLTPKDILLDLKVDDLALTKNIPSQIRQALYLIFKEAITNCAKHSTGDRVQVHLQKFGNKGLEMSIHDNGEVQVKNHKSTGLGLSNMRMRAEQIGGTFQVDTTQGFLIVVQIPRFS